MDKRTVLNLIGLCLYLSSCGPTPSRGGWANELSPYVEAFKAEATAHGRFISSETLGALTVTFGDVQAACSGLPKVVGCCSQWTDGTRLITLDAKFWNNAPDSGKFELIYHELGHCLLNQAHRGVMDVSTGFPTSIMYPSYFSGEYFAHHVNEYTRELFSQ